MTHAPPLEFSIEAAKQAGSIVCSYRGKELTRSIKTSARDFATEADVAAENHIITAIQKQFPHDAIVAEESGSHNKKGADYTWIIDPLDGTYNFSVGSDDFGVMIARAHGSVLELAVMLVNWLLLELLEREIPRQ
jgi:myo-inositol-1(or 4)-monophosphatase